VHAGAKELNIDGQDWQDHFWQFLILFIPCIDVRFPRLIRMAGAAVNRRPAGRRRRGAAFRKSRIFEVFFLETEAALGYYSVIADSRRRR